MCNYYIKSSVVIVVLCLVLGCNKSSTEYSILNFEAVNDTTVLSTVAIQQVIDMCTPKGGKVIVQAGKYRTGTINFKSNVEFHLAKGPELPGSVNIAGYSKENRGAIEAPAFDTTLLYAENAKQVKITGKGVINGRGYRSNFPVKMKNGELGDRLMLLRFINCSNTLFADVTFKNSAS